MCRQPLHACFLDVSLGWWRSFKTGKTLQTGFQLIAHGNGKLRHGRDVDSGLQERHAVTVWDASAIASALCYCPTQASVIAGFLILRIYNLVLSI